MEGEGREGKGEREVGREGGRIRDAYTNTQIGCLEDTNRKIKNPRSPSATATASSRLSQSNKILSPK